MKQTAEARWGLSMCPCGAIPVGGAVNCAFRVATVHSMCGAGQGQRGATRGSTAIRVGACLERNLVRQHTAQH
eukprot:3423766-Prymnesium_polylepis.1